MNKLYDSIGQAIRDAIDGQGADNISDRSLGETACSQLPAWFKNEYETRLKLGETMIKLNRTKQAAITLRKHLGSGDIFTIGSNTTGLNIWMRCKKGAWRGPSPTEWEGFPVEWRWECGQAEAQTNQQD